MRGFAARISSIVVLLFVQACLAPPVQPLDDLTVVDSVYVDPATEQPYSGLVERRFEDDSTTVQIRGELAGGVWDGELIVYHPNGRVRYMGSFVDGKQCGPWIENADSTPTLNAYEDLVREVESMGMYPPCEGDTER